MQLINTNSFCLVSIISITSFMFANGACPKPCSVIEGALKTLDNTIQTLKSSKQETDSLDELVIHSVKEIDNTVIKLKNETTPEQRRAAELLCKKEIKQAQQNFKQLFNYHKKNLEENLDCVFNKKSKEKIINQAESCVRSIRAKAHEPEINVSLDILKGKLAHVDEPLTQALDNLAEQHLTHHVN